MRNREPAFIDNCGLDNISETPLSAFNYTPVDPYALTNERAEQYVQFFQQLDNEAKAKEK